MSLLLPVLSGASMWSLVVLPLAQRSAGCDWEEAQSLLVLGGGLTTTVCGAVTMGTLLRFRDLEPHWRSLVAAALTITAAEGFVVLATRSVTLGWALGCR
jgi:hypothetical protein